jgi:hypothetical protein
MSGENIQELTVEAEAGDDTYHTVGLAATAQVFRGGDGTDSLTVDPEGLGVTDDGSTISIEGAEPIAYEGAELVLVLTGTDAEEPTDAALTYQLSTVYPNPVASARAPVRFVMDLPAPAEVQVTLFDVLGRRVLREAMRISAGDAQEVRVAVGGLGAGVYTYRVHVALATGDVSTAMGRLTLVR